MKFVQDTSKFWYKPDISRDQGKYWFWTGEPNGHFQEENSALCKGLLFVQCEHGDSNYSLSVFPPSAEQQSPCLRTKSRARSLSGTVIHFVGRMDWP